MSQPVCIDDALSAFIDILNAHGPDSRQAKEFRRQHSQETELLRLMDESVAVHREHHTKPLPN